jgi:hypothetical protein
MKIIKLASLAFVALSLSSCLKTANDFAGLRTDNGQVVTAITEKQYQVNDGHNLGQGYVAYAGFSFGAPASESVRFFALHISQPKAKISGSMTVKVAMTASGMGTLPPAGAITVADITVPANNEDGFDVPVMFTVNKALLNPATQYAATFTISSVSQGVTSALENSVEVLIENSKYMARYDMVSTVTDPAGQYGVANNTKPMTLYEPAANVIGQQDLISGTTAGLQVATLATGAAVNMVTALRYAVDASGKVTGVFSGATNLNATIDPSSQFVYTSNTERSLTVSYTFNFTSTINGVSTTRPISVKEKYTYTNKLQAYL